MKQNEEELTTLKEIFELYLTEKKLHKAAVIRDSNLDRNYAYQIFKGEGNTGRDKLLCLAFGMKLNIPETQRLLKAGKTTPLYPRDRRDVFILEALYQGKNLIECNEILEAHDLDILN